MKLFYWKLCRGSLPLGANLASRGLMAANSCPYCGLEETALHLIFLCTFATQVWSLTPFTYLLCATPQLSLHSAIKEISGKICLPPCGIIGDLASWICWSNWTARNQLIFENRHISAQTTVSKALSSAREWQAAQ